MSTEPYPCSAPWAPGWSSSVVRHSTSFDDQARCRVHVSPLSTQISTIVVVITGRDGSARSGTIDVTANTTSPTYGRYRKRSAMNVGMGMMFNTGAREIRNHAQPQNMRGLVLRRHH